MSQPLVSILTPVYNGEKYLAECIESVLAQSHQNWEYIIVNNSSTDRTQEIAQHYASRDSRVSLVDYGEHVSVIDNHNRAFRLISPHSTYCKVVAADDWIYPECISTLVEFAERNRSVGIVGSYAISGKGIAWPRLHYDTSVFNGHNLCRLYLLGEIDAFATPSTVLYRSALVRDHEPFYPGSAPSADLAMCFICLKACDFGFVHQILSFQRIHTEAISSKLQQLNSFFVDRIEFVIEYGPEFLSEAECESVLAQLMKEYYKYLAIGVVNCRSREFWEFHKGRLERMGRPLNRGRLAQAVLEKLADLIFNPKQTIERVNRRLERNHTASVTVNRTSLQKRTHQLECVDSKETISSS